MALVNVGVAGGATFVNHVEFESKICVRVEWLSIYVFKCQKALAFLKFKRAIRALSRILAYSYMPMAK
jgi:hypothetical protein